MHRVGKVLSSTPHAWNSSTPKRSTNFLKSTLQLGIELRLWVAGCVTGLSVFSYRALTEGSLSEKDVFTSNAPFFVVFLSTLALYNLDGTLDAPRAGKARRRKVHLTLTAFSCAALFYFLIQLPALARTIALGGAIFSALYAIPLTWGRKRTSLKKIAGLKAPFVGVAVAVAVVIVPILSRSPVVFWPAFSLLIITLALYCTANAFLFDIPDRQVDKLNDVPTQASLRGLDSTKRLCTVLCLAGMLFSLLIGFTTIGPLKAAYQVNTAASLFFLGVLLLISSHRVNETTSRTAVAWRVDGALLVPYIVQFVFEQWV